MTFLPILERELRVRARNRITWWMRLAVAFAGVVVCLPQLMIDPTPFNTPALIGRGVFNGIIGAAFLLCSGACLLTADAIGRERREGTLGLLLVTRVNVLDVLLGKLGSIGLAGLCALLAILPILMIPVLAGGVTGGEAARKGLALVNCLFSALTIGLYAAAARPDRFRAARRALLLFLAVAVLPLIAGWIFQRTMITMGLRWISLVSPLGILTSAADSAYKASAGPYWTSMALLPALNCLLLGWTGNRLRRGLREEDGRGFMTRAAPVRRVSAPPSGCPWLAVRDKVEPAEWLMRRQRGLAPALWAAAFIGFSYYGLFSFGFRFIGVSSIAPVSWSLGLAVSALSGALITWAASRFFFEARRSGELELLLTTPIGAGALVSAQWRVLKALLRWPIVVMLAPLLLQIVFYLVVARFPAPIPWRFYYTVSCLFGAVNTFLGIWALCWLGFWFGLRASGQARAILWAVGLVKGFPYLLSLLYSMLSRSFTSGVGGPATPWYWLLLWLPPQIFDLVLYLWLIRLARRQLVLDLEAVEPSPISFAQLLSHTVGDTLVALRRARRWTPS